MSAAAWISFTRKFVGLSLFFYSVLTTVLLLKLKLEPVLIGIDPYDTRILGEKDELFQIERTNFLQKFLTIFYNYDSESYLVRISHAGDLMSSALWKEKENEFFNQGESLKNQDIVQKSKIDDIRKIDELTYEADLSIVVRKKLFEKKVKLRVSLKLKRTKRVEKNPYSYEISSYEENILS